MISFLDFINLKLAYSFLVGGLGSAAYITALYFKFIGDNDDNRSIIFGPFCRKYTSDVSILKCFWYCAVGGLIAVVFQFDVPNFVAVQSLILGATWPAIVSQFLSGRMASPSKQELDKLFAPTFKNTKIDARTLEQRIKEIKLGFKKPPEKKQNEN